MRDFINKYFNEEIPTQKRMLYLASFLGIGTSLFFVALGLILKINPFILILAGSIALAAMLCLNFNYFVKNTTLSTCVYIVIVNIVIFPSVLMLTDKNTCEMPVYFLIGLAYSLILLEGKLRILFFSLQVVVDFAVAYYCFVVRMGDTYLSTMDAIDYIRIVMAILITGIVCGILIAYRNHILFKEIAIREEANKKAEKVSYAKDMFLVNVSHEIRTPLNAIIGTTEMLLDSEANDHIKEMAYHISNSSHALLSITSDLLDFSRMNIDTLRPQEEKYDIALMLNDIINLMSVRLLDSDVEFYVNINSSIPKILIGDSGKIRQIIINMLSNAIKYTNKGHICLNVDFEYEGRDCVHLSVKVEDTGIGIKPESIEKIFEPYNRSGGEITDRLVEGNGLGLALCRKLAIAMGGKIYATSKYQEGSVFYFDVSQSMETPYVGGVVGGLKQDDIRIAFYDSSEDENSSFCRILGKMNIDYLEVRSDKEFLRVCAAKEYTYYLIEASIYERIKESMNENGVDWNSIVLISSCNYSFSGEPFSCVLTRPVSCLNIADLINHTSSYAIRKQNYEGEFTIPSSTILIVDDNIVNLEVAEGLLAKYKGRIITASSGREGIITLQQEKVDMVFLDYMMPEMDGIDTLKEIRAIDDEAIHSIPVIALTANVVSGAREMFLNAGFDDYLSKPIEIDKIEKVILEHLNKELIVFNLE